MVIATENEDQQQLWYIFGRIMYYLMDIKPIMDAAYDIDDVNAFGEKHATIMDVIRTFGKLMEMQGKIQSGEIQLPDQQESYKRDKEEFERLLHEQRVREAMEQKAKALKNQKKHEKVIKHMKDLTNVMNATYQ